MRCVYVKELSAELKKFNSHGKKGVSSQFKKTLGVFNNQLQAELRRCCRLGEVFVVDFYEWFLFDIYEWCLCGKFISLKKVR